MQLRHLSDYNVRGEREPFLGSVEKRSASIVNTLPPPVRDPRRRWRATYIEARVPLARGRTLRAYKYPRGVSRCARPQVKLTLPPIRVFTRARDFVYLYIFIAAVRGIYLRAELELAPRAATLATTRLSFSATVVVRICNLPDLMSLFRLITFVSRDMSENIEVRLCRLLWIERGNISEK